MKDKIKWQAPPVHQPDHQHPTVKAVAKRPNKWALAATVGPSEVPEWWPEVIFNPAFRYEIHPQDPADPQSQRDVYILFRTETHEH